MITQPGGIFTKACSLQTKMQFACVQKAKTYIMETAFDLRFRKYLYTCGQELSLVLSPWQELLVFKVL